MTAKAKGVPSDAGIKTGAKRQPPQAGKPQSTPSKGKAPPQSVKPASHLHGAEALAALVVAESKVSRLQGRMLLFVSVCLMLSLGWNSILSATRPEPKLLATTSDGRIFPLPLLDAPIESRTVIISWVKRNIPSLYDMNYVNYRSAQNKALDFTRRQTMESFSQDLESSGILPKIKDEFLILRANIVNEPVIITERVIQERRVWVVEVPMDLIYDSGEVNQGQRRVITQPILFTAWIARASPVEFDGGLMLAKYNVKNRRD
jgi:hypothetical protein